MLHWAMQKYYPNIVFLLYIRILKPEDKFSILLTVPKLHLTVLTYLIDRIMCTDDFDVLNNSTVKIEALPRFAIVLAVIYHSYPVLLLYRHFNIVRI